MGSSAFCLASACFLALLCQPVLLADSLENCCSRSLYRQRCTGLTLLLGPEHQALQLMLKSCLAWGSAGEKSPSFDHRSCIKKLLAGLKALQTHLPWAGAFPLSAPPASTQQWDQLVPHTSSFPWVCWSIAGVLPIFKGQGAPHAPRST